MLKTYKLIVDIPEGTEIIGMESQKGTNILFWRITQNNQVGLTTDRFNAIIMKAELEVSDATYNIG